MTSLPSCRFVDHLLMVAEGTVESRSKPRRESSIGPLI
jgi:hypothetical protein